jgi:hypothetical protein
MNIQRQDVSLCGSISGLCSIVEGVKDRKRGARCPDGTPRVVTIVCTRSIACYKARKQYKIREDEIRVESRLGGALIPLQRALLH